MSNRTTTISTPLHIAPRGSDWITTEIRRGLQKLLLLSLDRAPAGDVSKGTVRVWVEAMEHAGVWDEARDARRFREAFAALAATCERWPTPKALLEALTSVPHTAHREYFTSAKRVDRGHRLEDGGARERSMQHVSKLLQRFGLPPVIGTEDAAKVSGSDDAGAGR